VWRPGGSYNQFLEPTKFGTNVVGHVRFDLERPDWAQLRVLQLLMSDDTTAVAEVEESLPTELDRPTGDNITEERLSTIPEGTQETEPSDDHLPSVGSYLQHSDSGMQEALNQVSDRLELPLPDEHRPEQRDELNDRMPLSLLTASVDEVTLAEPSDGIYASYVELAVCPPMSNIVGHLPRKPEPGEIVLLQVGPNTMRQEVVQRDDDILTPAQLKEHWPEVRKAMLKELQTWATLKCFSRKARKSARNIIDVRWVVKFKWEVPTSDASGSRPTEARTPVRTIRARLTVRGFKDQQKADIDRYAGTSSRCAQKLIVSEAAKNGWDICTADVPKAFLQGVTYEQLAEMTGEPLREVNFYLPADNIPLLRMIPGFEDFDPQNEVLHCDKPGTGVSDALRAFSMKLSKVADERRLVPSQIDNEVFMRHDEGRLTAVMSKHVDDLKLAGVLALSERSWLRFKRSAES